ncbi:MAG: hypothetical protein B7Y41_06780 [Hydrogenophilales bacterium 28-61-23]|nr:MAG: hypothetical protein B7Y41_06780 [Hydrogenophilales bacterium 28-61-23]
MKTTSMLKTLRIGALVALASGAGLASADNGSCLLGSNTQMNAQMNTQTTAPAMLASANDAGEQMMLNSMEARLNQQLERIEQGLRGGQISPMQAGKLMREQWEAVQFQRGFLEGNRAGKASGGDGCSLGQNIDAKQLAAKLVPVVSGMAAEGMQTATTVLRAVAKEAQKLIREQSPMDERL